MDETILEIPTVILVLSSPPLVLTGRSADAVRRVSDSRHAGIQKRRQTPYGCQQVTSTRASLSFSLFNVLPCSWSAFHLSQHLYLRSICLVRNLRALRQGIRLPSIRIRVASTIQKESSLALNPLELGD